MKKKASLFDEVVNVTHKYLGPAADRFCARQIEGHLDKDPTKLRERDLQNLIVWFCLAMATLSEDPAIVRQYEADLRLLNDGR